MGTVNALAARGGADGIPGGGRWQDQAACRDADPGLFFPVGDSIIAVLQTANARQLCAICAVRPQCLRWALGRSETHGIRGGTTEAERLALRPRAGPAGPALRPHADQ